MFNKIFKKAGAKPAPKPVILVNYHLYKNAGSSVDKSIRTAVGADNFVELDKHEDYRTSSAYNATLLNQVLAERPNMRGFASHAFVATVHRCEDFVALPIVFLRHPLLRMASVYRFEAASELHKTTPSGELARRVDFPEWLEAYIDMASGKNYQTCMLSLQEDGIHSKMTNAHPRHIGDIRVATERLDEVKELIGVGIVEDFEASAAQIEERISRHVPEFKLTDTIANQTKKIESWQEELRQLEQSLPRDVLVRAVTSNASDFALYERYR